MAKVETAFAENDEVFLIGEFRTPRNIRRKMVMIQAHGTQSRTRFELSVDFKQPQGLISSSFKFSFTCSVVETNKQTHPSISSLAEILSV